ncbi:MAG: hypothetical protein ISS31_04810 [Kiritimatiellae bacterium]|nr:hypothetical protein [Kiritimatiellia bacterium]
MVQRRLFLAAGWLLPFVLAALFILKGQHYDPAFFTPPAVQGQDLPVPLEVGHWQLEGGQLFPADRMFEKINGKADYYLQYDAVELCSGEWIAGDQHWDMYLYRFKDADGARYAFSGERPGNPSEIDGIKGYRVPGQVAVLTGTSYLQLNAHRVDADTAPAETLARELVAYLGESSPVADSKPDQSPATLAGDALIKDSEGLLPEGAFGFSVLNEVQTARVSLSGAEAIWFKAPGDIETLMAYAAELKLYGGAHLFEQDGATGGLMFSSWELAGVVDGVLWGVHAAPSREALLAHWNALRSALQGDQP